MPRARLEWLRADLSALTAQYDRITRRDVLGTTDPDLGLDHTRPGQRPGQQRAADIHHLGIGGRDGFGAAPLGHLVHAHIIKPCGALALNAKHELDIRDITRDLPGVLHLALGPITVAKQSLGECAPADPAFLRIGPLEEDDGPAILAAQGMGLDALAARGHVGGVEPPGRHRDEEMGVGGLPCLRFDPQALLAGARILGDDCRALHRPALIGKGSDVGLEVLRVGHVDGEGGRGNRQDQCKHRQSLLGWRLSNSQWRSPAPCAAG